MAGLTGQLELPLLPCSRLTEECTGSFRNSALAQEYVWQLVAQMVKKLLVVQEAQVQSLGQEDPPEKGMATHSGILAWRIP